jgi:hypothetical protein
MALVLFQAYLIDEEGDRRSEKFFMSPESAHEYLSAVIECDYADEGDAPLKPLSEWDVGVHGYQLPDQPYGGWYCRIRSIEAEP